MRVFHPIRRRAQAASKVRPREEDIPASLWADLPAYHPLRNPEPASR